MKKFIPLALVLAVFTAGAAIALARTIHNGAAQGGPDAVSGRPAAAGPSKGTISFPIANSVMLCDLQLIAPDFVSLNPGYFLCSSPPGLTRWSMPRCGERCRCRECKRRVRMDCRIKPGNDGMEIPARNHPPPQSGGGGAPTGPARSGRPDDRLRAPVGARGDAVCSSVREKSANSVCPLHRACARSPPRTACGGG